MKARPVKLVDGQYAACPITEATHLTICIPGPQGRITLPVLVGNGTRAGTGCWSWNGDVERPTLRPSVLTQAGHYAPQHQPDDTCWCTYYADNPHESPVFSCYRCHTWINDGQAQFLSDSTHAHAGKTLDLLDVNPN